MTGHPKSPPSRLTLADRALRSALVMAVAILPRRPSYGWHRLAARQNRPCGMLPQRALEFAQHGGPRAVIEPAVIRGVREMFDAIYGAVPGLPLGA